MNAVAEYKTAVGGKEFYGGKIFRGSGQQLPGRAVVCGAVNPPLIVDGNPQACTGYADSADLKIASTLADPIPSAVCRVEDAAVSGSSPHH